MAGRAYWSRLVVQNDYSLQALDAKTGTLRWKASLGVLACTSPWTVFPQIAASESHLYVLTRKRHIRCRSLIRILARHWRNIQSLFQ